MTQVGYRKAGVFGASDFGPGPSRSRRALPILPALGTSRRDCEQIRVYSREDHPCKGLGKVFDLSGWAGPDYSAPRLLLEAAVSKALALYWGNLAAG